VRTRRVSGINHVWAETMTIHLCGMNLKPKNLKSKAKFDR